MVYNNYANWIQIVVQSKVQPPWPQLFYSDKRITVIGTDQCMI